MSDSHIPQKDQLKPESVGRNIAGSKFSDEKQKVATSSLVTLSVTTANYFTFF